MNAQQILEAAKSQVWKRGQVKAACYEHKVPVAEREAIYAALGMAPTAAAVPSPPTENARPVTTAPAPRKAKGVMTLKYAATDFLTGSKLEAGTDAIGVKMGGRWDFTAAPGVSLEDARRALEVLLLSMGDDEGGPHGVLDHEDYRTLLQFGERFPYYAARIATEVPGLAN